MTETKNQYKQEYDEKKEKILELLEDTKAYYDKNQLNDKTEAIETQIQNLKNNEFSIVVVGEFSAGKSTFLNALMGDWLLPSFSDPATSTINFLKHKSKAPDGADAVVYYNDGHTEKIQHATRALMEKYVTTKNKDSTKDINHVDYYIDSKFLNEGVMLVDSPGLNAMEAGHTEMTQAQIDKSNASIFMFRANQPASETDFNALKKLKLKVSKIIFVLNRIDEIKSTENETPESMAKTIQSRYKEVFPGEEIPEIIPIAAYPALLARTNEKMDYRGKTEHTEEEKKEYLKISRFEDFENRLWKFLTNGEKAKEVLTGPVEKIIGFLSEEKSQVEENLSYFENTQESSTEIEEQIRAIEESEEDIQDKINGVKADINSDLRDIAENILDIFADEMNKFEEEEISIINSWDNVEAYVNYAENINDKFKRQMKRISRKVEKAARNEIEDLLSQTYSGLVENADIPGLKVKTSIEDFSLSADEFDSGMREFDRELERRQSQIEKIEEEIASAGDDLFMAEELKMMLEEKKAEISGLENQKRIYETGALKASSNYESHQETTYVDGKPRGIIGGIKWVLVGSGTVKREVTVDNMAVIEKEKKEYTAKANEKQMEINQLKEEIRSLGNPKTGQIKHQIEAKQRKLERIEKEIENYKKKYNEEFKKRKDNYIRTAKNNVRREISNLSEELSDQIEDEIRKFRNETAGALAMVLNAKLNSDLKKKKCEKERLLKQLNGTAEEMENGKKECDERISALDNILERAVLMKTNLSRMEIFTAQDI